MTETYRMSTRTLSTLALLAAISITATAPARAGASGELVVTLAPGASIDALNARYGTRTLGAIPAAGAYKLEAPSAGPTLDRLRGDPAVRSAKRDAKVRRHEGLSFPFDDPVDAADGGEGLYRAQIAQGGSLSGIAIRQAQSVAAGGEPVVVAVLDTGVDLGHPAVAGNVWENAAERDGQPGVDDDGDGAIDDRFGYDFVDGDADPSESGEEGPVAGHGTFIAGLVALASPNARVMSLRVLDGDGVGSAFDAAAAIEYAVAHGARVVNVSFGADRHFDAPLLRRAVADAEARGAIVVAATGNDGEPRIPYPANDARRVVAVGASDGGARAEFSNYSPNRGDLAWAPGVALVSAMPGGASPRYARWSGTSFATALVTALAATMISVAPDASTDSVRSYLKHSDGYTALTNAGGWRVNCLEAVVRIVLESGAVERTSRATTVGPGDVPDFGGSATLRVLRAGTRETAWLSLAATRLDGERAYTVSLRASGQPDEIVAGTVRSMPSGEVLFTAELSGAAAFAPSAATEVVVSDAAGAVVRTAGLSAAGDTNTSIEAGMVARAGSSGPRGTVGYVYAAAGGQTFTVHASGLEPKTRYRLVVDGNVVSRDVAYDGGGLGGCLDLRFVSSAGAGTPSLRPLPEALDPVIGVRRVELWRVGGPGAAPELSVDLGPPPGAPAE